MCIHCLVKNIYFLSQLFLERRIRAIAMNPNSNNGPSMIPQPRQTTVLAPAKTKQQERLEKGIQYFASEKFKIQLLLTAVFSVVEIVFGVEYFNQCPIKPQIPLFLLVHGSAKLGWVACGIIAFIEAKFCSNSPHIRLLMLINFFIQLLFFVLFFAWMVIGNVWFWSVNGTVQTSDSSATSTYCQNTLYQAAKGIIISTFVVLGIIIIITVRRRLCAREH